MKSWRLFLACLCTLSWLLALNLIRAAPVAFGQAGGEAQEHANKGAQFASRNDLKDAEAELRRAVELSPNNATYLTGLGGILGMQRKLEESSVFLEKALKLDPDNIVARRNLASNEWQSGRLEDARQNLERILKVQPQDPRTILLLGMVAESAKEYAKAVKLLGSVPDLVQQQPDSIVALAHAYYRTGEREKARQVLAVLLNHPAWAQGVFRGGQVAADAEDYETAERLLGSIRSAYAEPSTLGYQLALVEYRAGHFDKCQNTLAELLEADHRSVDIYDLLALCYHRQGKSEEAIRTLNESLQRIPHTEADYLKLGDMLLRHRLFMAALVTAKKALETAPNSAKAYRLKGTVELELYYYKDAIQTFSRALQLDPSSAEADLGLALAHWGAGETSEAGAAFEEGLKRFPQDSSHYTKYARFLRERAELNGDRTADSQVIAVLQKAISINPSEADPHSELGNFLLTQGKDQQALKELETAAKLDADSSSIRYSLSRAYRRLGRNQEASKAMADYQRLKTKEDSVL